jgi:hypothetical protein
MRIKGGEFPDSWIQILVFIIILAIIKYLIKL